MIKSLASERNKYPSASGHMRCMERQERLRVEAGQVTIDLIDALLEEQKSHAERLAEDARAVVQDRRHTYDMGASSLDKRTYDKLQTWYKATLKEYEGIVTGCQTRRIPVFYTNRPFQTADRRGHVRMADDEAQKAV